MKGGSRPTLLALALLLAASVAPACLGDSLSELRQNIPSDDNLIFAVRLDASTLSEALPANYRDGQLLLPLGELCRLLELAITVDAGRGMAAGFLIDPQRKFRLDLALGRVEIAGIASDFDSRRVQAEADDLYVESALLEAWLPLRLHISFGDLLIAVETKEKFPLQLRLEREKKLAARRPALAAAALPKFALPYRLAEVPFFDASLRYSRRGEATSGNGDELAYSLAASGDLLFLEASLFLFGNGEEILDSRLTLGRKDPEGRLLGRLRARAVGLGEVYHPGLELITLPRSGPGFEISNFPLEQSSQFGRESFRGDLPPGWEAELYRGEELLDYQPSRPDGLYEFLDVPLLAGINEFRIELYGPQGQRQSERRRLNVGDAMTPAGELRYRLSGSDPGARLIGAAPAAVGRRASFELAAGLARHLSTSFSLATVDYLGRDRRYAAAGLRTFRGPLLASLDLAYEESGGLAWQGDLQGRWRGLGLRLQHAELGGLDSERFVSAAGSLSRRSWLRLDTVLAPRFLPRLPLYFELRQDQLTSGRRQNALTARLSAFRNGFAVSHQLQYSFAEGGPLPLPESSAAGLLLLSRLQANLSWRGEIDYRLAPRSELTSLALKVEARRPRGYLVAAGINRLWATGENRYQVGLSHLEGPFGFTLAADYADTAGFGVSLLLSFSLSRDRRSGAWYAQAKPLASGGALSARAFLDSNGNGRLDPGEEPVAGAGLLLGSGTSRQRTSANGEVYLTNLPPYRPLAVGLAPNTLEDPYWQPAQPGRTILPRPGKVAVIDFPVEVAGEIFGSIFLQRAGKRRPAGGIEVELVDPAGAVVARARSAGDGFYDLARLRPGRYALRIAPAQLDRLEVRSVPSREVVLAPEGSVIEDLNFVLLVREESGSIAASSAD